MLVAAAFIPATPLLVPQVASGAADELAELRASAVAAVGTLVQCDSTEIVILGIAPRTGAYPADARIDFGALGIASSAAVDDREPLPRSLSVGRWVLDRAFEDFGHGDPLITAFGVTDDAPAARCRDLGSALAERSERVAALVVGDGSARRSAKAPGAFDAVAAPFDEAWTSALAEPDVVALETLDEALARTLMVEGRAPWQIAAGMAAGGAWTSSLLATADPYGVLYAVATWMRSTGSGSAGIDTP